MTPGVRAALACLLPLALAATDPRGDVGPCGRVAAPDPGTDSGSNSGPASEAGDRRVDIVAARAVTTESGTALRFSVTFARRLDVPDEEGTPFRVDVVLRDPDVPVVSFRYYRDLNRIIRYDAVPDALVQILLLPERGANVFAGAEVTGPTLTIEVPGRLVRRDRDLEGLGLRRLRWSVISRDESDCDVLGDGSPADRIHPGPEPSASSTSDPSTTAPSPSAGAEAPGSTRWVLVAVLLVAVFVVALGIVRRRRGRARAGEPALRSSVDRGDEFGD